MLSQLMDPDDVGGLPRWLAAAFTVAIGGGLVYLSYQSMVQRPAGVRALALASAVAIALCFGETWLRGLDRHRTERQVALLVAAAGSITLLVLTPVGPGVLGTYLTLLIASRLGMLGAVVAATTAGVFLALLVWLDVSRERAPEVATLLFNLAGLTAAYVLPRWSRQAQRIRVERAAEHERERVAREIHDVLAHTLSALAVQLEATRVLAERRPGDPGVAEAIGRSHRLAREGLDEARRAVGALRGEAAPGPDELPALVRGFQDESAIPCHLVVEGSPTPLQPDVRLALYRTAQEALTNVRKHAHPAEVTVRLVYRGGHAELTVEDHGGGAFPPAPPDPGGHGLTGIRERAALLGGTLEAGPVPGGFRVRLEVPA
ncbi:MAG TPA: sensor histidine kinase [Candidatus Binatia bacterium]|nr:sensor histidine kinase [Candidatus Binatia bacterium]